MDSETPVFAPVASDSEARARPGRGFDLIVFDWDGTLMDSLGTIVACAQASSTDLGTSVPSAAAVRDLVGLHLRDMARSLVADGDDAMQQRWVERYRHHWIHGFYDRLAPIEGAAEVLERLSAEAPMLAVATGKSRRGLDRDLESTGFGRHFLASRTVDESPSKPSPGMLLELMDELGCVPEKTLMVGDTTHDVIMARNARVTCLGVLTGSHDRPRLESEGAVECVPSVRELPAWLGY